MEWLNYHHLFYFWMIVREGGVARAAERLRLTHSTLSAQLRSLEAFLGAELFERRGKRLVLTPFGTEVASYAEEIFRLGSELVDVARLGSSGLRSPLRVGILGLLPRSVVYRLLEPALDQDGGGLVQIRQATIERLVEDLAAHRLDLALSDAPPQGAPFRIHAHLLGETGIDLYGAKALARRHGGDFPRSLEGAPVLVPPVGSGLRRSLDRWLAEHDVHVRIVGEIDDAGLLRVLGAHGRGLFPVRAALRTEVEEAHGAVRLGPVDGVRERYYVLTSERRIRHRGVASIVEAARSELTLGNLAGRGKRR